jgi:hypothetical protein
MIKSLYPSLLIATLVGCATVTPQVLDANQSQTQLQLRQAQSRTFDTNDRERTLRSVIATLQDLSFVIDKADPELGTVSATKLDGYAMRMTVTVRPKGTQQLVVRANAQMNTTPITDPAPYQSFFNALERSIFLATHSVD